MEKIIEKLLLSINYILNEIMDNPNDSLADIANAAFYEQELYYYCDFDGHKFEIKEI